MVSPIDRRANYSDNALTCLKMAISWFLLLADFPQQDGIEENLVEGPPLPHGHVGAVEQQEHVLGQQLGQKKVTTAKVG